MKLKDLNDVDHHPISEKVVDVLRQRTQNTGSDSYFRTVTSFYFALMAASMRTSVNTQDRGILPVNLYALCTGDSGLGKGFSMNIIENTLLQGFREKFTEDTFPAVAEKAMDKEAVRLCQRHGTEYDSELDKLHTEANSYGSIPFSFAEGSAPAYKQIRSACQVATIGATNYIVDEVGSNLNNASELWNTLLECFDGGLVKDKITKNSSDNKRYKQRHTPVPSNMLAFGTPSKLLDGGRTEADFTTFLETGYGRRFLYGVGVVGKAEYKNVEDLYDSLVKSVSSTDVSSLQTLFTNLADEVNFNRIIGVDRTEGIILLQYKLNCEELAEKYGEHEGIPKAELEHRYFKALKLAAAYAFIDSTPNVTTDQLYAAIKVTEESGEAFKKIYYRPKNYVRLAKYISSVDEEVTHADITVALPFYPSAKNKQEELLALATAWGYKHHHIIKRYVADNIEFFKGEALQETDLDKMSLSYIQAPTHSMATTGFTNQLVKWEGHMEQLCQHTQVHWVSHALQDGYRDDDHVIAGFNMIVLDVDGGVTVNTVAQLLKDTTCYMYTTKRHTNTANRFRVVIPLKYNLKMGKKEYKDFMNNIISHFPFDIDECSNQRSKKWLSHSGSGGYITGELFNPLPFIPKTQKNVERENQNKELANLPKVEQYFAKRWNSGRNNCLLAYGMMLLDSKIPLFDAQEKLRAFNASFSDSLSDDELNNSVFITMSKKVV